LNIEQLFHDKILKKKKIKKEANFDPQYQIFVDLLESYTNYRGLWQDAIDIGIKDGSIKSQSNPYHLNFIIIMIILGLLDQIDFRRSLMAMVKISNVQIKGFILNLVKKLLEGEV
jgi:hypothetical protein